MLTFELAAAIIAVAAAAVGIWMNLRRMRRDDDGEQAKQVSATVSIETKLEFIANDVKEIKLETKKLYGTVADHEARIKALERRNTE